MKNTDLEAVEAALLANEYLAFVANRRCSLVAEDIAVVVTATLLVAAENTSFHFSESDICRFVYFGDGILFYFIVSLAVWELCAFRLEILIFYSES